MTEAEFQERWLTIGTDSKVSGGTLTLPMPEGVVTPRPVLGEKGVGRLAVATVGPLVMVLTRSRRDGAPEGVTGALVHWGLFQIPGLDLDNIDITVIPLRRDEKPDNTLVGLLKDGLTASTQGLRGLVPDLALDSILGDIARFELDLPEVYAAIEGKRLDEPGDQGTHFFILPADRILESDMDDTGSYAATPLTKTLLGFTNTMVPGAPPPVIQASFVDHKLDDTKTDLIEDGAFFTPAEFGQADHHVNGSFDAHGQFRGSVTVYGNEPVPFSCAWPNPTGRPTGCGPFTINFAYVQGASRESRLDLGGWNKIIDKLNKYGGLYLYRDGVRILPYGNSDYDFLDLERKRSKGASYYFFSYRRMFGAIDITRAANGGLVEKAGREGFQENRAYRQFKQLLENLLMQVAADFFREGGIQADVWDRIKGELERNENIRRRRAKEASQQRGSLARKLNAFFEQTTLNRPATEAVALEERTKERLAAVAANTALDPDRAADELLRIEAEVRQAVETLQARYLVRKSAALGLTKPLLRDWASYREQYEKLGTEVFEPLVGNIEKALSDVTEEFGIPLDKRRRLDEALQEAATRSARQVDASVKSLDQQVATVAAAMKARGRQAVLSLSNLVTEVRSEFASTNLENLPGEQAMQVGARLRKQMAIEADLCAEALTRFQERLASVLEEDRERGTQEELLGALEEKVESLTDELDKYIELAQMGLAINVVQHDFGAAIETIRTRIVSLQPWAKANEDLADLYSTLRAAFEHLDAHLTLFLPLNRRIYRGKVFVRGENIALFLSSLLGRKLEGTEIRIEATDAFREYEIECYPSTFYPVFLNLADNAIHWIRESGIRPGLVLLDAQGRDLLVSDNGGGIAERDRAAVFDYGFTRKLEGRPRTRPLHLPSGAQARRMDHRRDRFRHRWCYLQDFPAAGP